MRLRNTAIIAVLATTFSFAFPLRGFARAPIATPAPSAVPVTVITLSVMRADRAARLVHQLFPRARVRADSDANALIVIATPSDLEAIRTIASGLDVRSATAPTVEPVPLRFARPTDVAARLSQLFRAARFVVAANRTLLVMAPPQDLTQIRSVVSALDAPPTTPTPKPSFPASIYHVTQAPVASLARAVARTLHGARVSVAGSNILIAGSPEDELQAKLLVDQLDRPAAGEPYVSVYRLTTVDAASVAALLQRSFPALSFGVAKDLNAISVTATAALHARIGDAIAQLEAAPSQSSGGFTAAAASPGSDTDVVSLRAAVPSTASGTSTSANDIAQTVTQALAQTAPDLRVTVQPNSTRLVLSGSSRSRELARDLIAKLDIADPLVELDTRVLEVDEGAQSQLGLRFPNPVLGTTYSELIPESSIGGVPQLLRLQPLTRTPLSLGAALDFLISNNKARILEDPRITTFSGRTASLRAGETVNILTTTGGGSGTIATTQVQSFQTGVTLDITPVVNTDDYITVTLHPSVNSIAGIGSSGVPNIQTRDTTTTIGLHDGETLIIGGLIEDVESKTTSKIPLFGDLPIIGRLFQDTGTSHTRNELVVTVTPHILRGGLSGAVARPSETESAAAFPTVAPDATLPPIRSSQAPSVPGGYHLSTLLPPAPRPSPSESPVPAPLPTAFEQTNVFVFGQAPSDNFAGEGQAPVIFYVRASPTVVKNGTLVTISAITTTNVKSLTLGPTPMLQQVKLASIGPGKWQSRFALDVAQLPSASGNVSEALTASTEAGSSTSVRIPFSLAP